MPKHFGEIRSSELLACYGLSGHFNYIYTYLSGAVAQQEEEDPCHCLRFCLRFVSIGQAFERRLVKISVKAALISSMFLALRVV